VRGRGTAGALGAQSGGPGAGAARPRAWQRARSFSRRPAPRTARRGPACRGSRPCAARPHAAARGAARRRRAAALPHARAPRHSHVGRGDEQRPLVGGDVGLIFILGPPGVRGAGATAGARGGRAAARGAPAAALRRGGRGRGGRRRRPPRPAAVSCWRHRAGPWRAAMARARARGAGSGDRRLRVKVLGELGFSVVHTAIRSGPAFRGGGRVEGAAAATRAGSVAPRITRGAGGGGAAGAARGPPWLRGFRHKAPRLLPAAAITRQAPRPPPPSSLHPSPCAAERRARRARSPAAPPRAGCRLTRNPMSGMRRRAAAGARELWPPGPAAAGARARSAGTGCRGVGRGTRDAPAARAGRGGGSLGTSQMHRREGGAGAGPSGDRADGRARRRAGGRAHAWACGRPRGRAARRAGRPRGGLARGQNVQNGGAGRLRAAACGCPVGCRCPGPG
jgi:hypothetical protein